MEIWSVLNKTFDHSHKHNRPQGMVFLQSCSLLQCKTVLCGRFCV